MSNSTNVSLIGVPGLPEIFPGDNLPLIIWETIQQAGLKLEDGDVLVIAHKVVSKSEGNIVKLKDVTPGKEAQLLGKQLNKDPRKIQVILDQSSEVIKTAFHPGKEEGLMICRHKRGYISANAAVDGSNVKDHDALITLPDDPDKSAGRICSFLKDKTDIQNLGIIISDSFGRPWRMGIVNVAVGVSGINALEDPRGQADDYGVLLRATLVPVADEIAAAAGLVMKKSNRTPVILMKGLEVEFTEGSSTQLIRPAKEDIFL